MITICAPPGMDYHQAMAYITAEIIHEVRARYPYDLASEILEDGSVTFGQDGSVYVGMFSPSIETSHRSKTKDRATFQRAAGMGICPPYPADMNCE